MHDDLTELSNVMDKGRKYWKQVGSSVEKKLHEAETLVERVPCLSVPAFMAALR
jgi:hypothetical protein